MRCKNLLLAALTALLAVGCMKPDYVGKSYAPTGSQPDIFVDWRDVPRDYETMGYATAYSKGYAFGVRNSAGVQQQLERMARERGADAIVIAPPESNPQLKTVEQIEHDDNGTTRSTTVVQHREENTGKLTAVFLKYKR